MLHYINYKFIKNQLVITLIRHYQKLFESVIAFSVTDFFPICEKISQVEVKASLTISR